MLHYWMGDAPWVMGALIRKEKNRLATFIASAYLSGFSFSFLQWKQTQKMILCNGNAQKFVALQYFFMSS